MSSRRKAESWSSRFGVIMAVAGSAVGLGNFLRFPGLAAEYGSGAFMIAYFISLLILGIPVCWAEWTLGRYAGQRGFHSSPGIFHALIRHPAGKYIGVIGVVVPVMIYMYYVYVEAWCLAYAWFSLTGNLSLGRDVAAYADFWARFTGAARDGAAFEGGLNSALVFLLIVFAVNFVIIYRGLSSGIELFCKWGMPALVILSIVVLARVLTLGAPDPAQPGQNVLNGLGFMWNPVKPGGAPLFAQLANPQLWLAAAGQVFFSLSVGFGVIITYASYLKNRDDVVLSGLTASSANTFCEVGLGGMITVPAAFIFLGAAGVVGQGVFGLGFNVLPLVFASMPLPWLFGFLWFFLLFLAAVTSSISMLQPGIAFLEEGLGLNRKQSVALLGLLTAMGCLFVVYFSKDLKALDTIDFWVGTLLLFVMATIVIITFGWVIGVEAGWREAHRGAALRIPNFFKFVMKYLCPAYLLTIFGLWVRFNMFAANPETGRLEPAGYVRDLIGAHANPAAQLSAALILVCIVFFCILTAAAGRRWERAARNNEEKAS